MKKNNLKRFFSSPCYLPALFFIVGGSCGKKSIRQSTEENPSGLMQGTSAASSEVNFANSTTEISNPPVSGEKVAEKYKDARKDIKDVEKLLSDLHKETLEDAKKQVDYALEDGNAIIAVNTEIRVINHLCKLIRLIGKFENRKEKVPSSWTFRKEDSSNTEIWGEAIANVIRSRASEIKKLEQEYMHITYTATQSLLKGINRLIDNSKNNAALEQGHAINVVKVIKELTNTVFTQIDRLQPITGSQHTASEAAKGAAHQANEVLQQIQNGTPDTYHSIESALGEAIEARQIAIEALYAVYKGFHSNIVQKHSKVKSTVKTTARTNNQACEDLSQHEEKSRQKEEIEISAKENKSEGKEIPVGTPKLTREWALGQWIRKWPEKYKKEWVSRLSDKSKMPEWVLTETQALTQTLTQELVQEWEKNWTSSLVSEEERKLIQEWAQEWEQEWEQEWKQEWKTRRMLSVNKARMENQIPVKLSAWIQEAARRIKKKKNITNRRK